MEIITGVSTQLLIWPPYRNLVNCFRARNHSEDSIENSNFQKNSQQLVRRSGGNSLGSRSKWPLRPSRKKFRKNRQFFENIPRKILHILNILEKCCILEKSRKKLVTYGRISAKFGQNSGKICESLEKNSKQIQQFITKILVKFGENCFQNSAKL